MKATIPQTGRCAVELTELDNRTFKNTAFQVAIKYCGEPNRQRESHVCDTIIPAIVEAINTANTEDAYRQAFDRASKVWDKLREVHRDPKSDNADVVREVRWLVDDWGKYVDEM